MKESLARYWLNKHIFIQDENELKLRFVLNNQSGMNPSLSLWFLWKKSTSGWRTPPMGSSLTFWTVFPTMWCLCSWTLCILKVNPLIKTERFPLEVPNTVSWLPGEWQTQFDPAATSKGVFYLDNKNSVSVDMMKSSQYPFRLLHDPELKSQVNQLLSGGCAAFSGAEVKTSGKDELKME